MAKLTIEVPEHLQKVVKDRSDIDWEDIISNCIVMVLDLYPDKKPHHVVQASEQPQYRRH